MENIPPILFPRLISFHKLFSKYNAINKYSGCFTYLSIYQLIVNMNSLTIYKLSCTDQKQCYNLKHSN